MFLCVSLVHFVVVVSMCDYSAVYLFIVSGDLGPSRFMIKVCWSLCSV